MKPAGGNGFELTVGRGGCSSAATVPTPPTFVVLVLSSVGTVSMSLSSVVSVYSSVETVSMSLLVTYAPQQTTVPSNLTPHE